MNKKIKINSLSSDSIGKIKANNIKKAKAVLEYCPFATTVYLCLKTKLPMSFIQENKKEIFGN